MEQTWTVAAAGETEPALLLRALRYAVRAPSSHNSQPWRFRVCGDTVELYADPARTLATVDPEGRETLIACGAALLNLRVTLARFGRAVAVDTGQDPTTTGWLARIRLVAGRPDQRLAALFPAVEIRHTYRGRFAHRPLAPGLLDQFAADATAEGARLVPLSLSGRLRVAALVKTADRVQARDRVIRREAAAWLRAPGSRRRDGVPSRNMGLSRTAAAFAPLVARFFGVSRAREDARQIVDAPLAAVLTTARDDRLARLAAGQALQRVLLRAALAGVSASFFSAVLDEPMLRDGVAAACGDPGHPQMLARLGYGLPAPGTPRRPVEDVLA